MSCLLGFCASCILFLLSKWEASLTSETFVLEAEFGSFCAEKLAGVFWKPGAWGGIGAEWTSGPADWNVLLDRPAAGDSMVGLLIRLRGTSGRDGVWGGDRISRPALAREAATHLGP